LSAVGAVSVALGLAFGAGCAHETVADRQLASLEDGLNRETAARDRVDPRLDAIKIQAEEQSKAAPADKSPFQAPHVVAIGALSPDGTPLPPSLGDGASTLNGEDPNDTAPRPVIRVVGSGLSRRGAHGRDDRIDETLPDEPANGVAGTALGPAIQVGAPPPSALDPNAKRAYDAALALVNAHDYDHALDAFAAFLVKWPDHPNADNAMYWRGECYFAKGEIARAAEEFEGTVKRFPLGNKVPDCLLKLGICQQKLGNQASSLAYFQRLTHEYPRSEAARRIPSAGASAGDRPAAHDTGRAGPQETP
jgi:tol-pal system protein YbgF